MRTLQISINYVHLLPTWAWSEYKVQNDLHGGLIALVEITDHYAELVEKSALPTDEAVEAIYRGSH